MLSNDVYTRITNKIIDDLEQGQLTWRKPWNNKNLSLHVKRPLRANDIPYTGINTVMLWATAADKGYTSPYWMTYKQARDMKAFVRAGEHGTQIVYADKFSKDEEKEDGTTESKEIAFLKLYTVFNTAQIEGLPSAYYHTDIPAPANDDHKREDVEIFFANTQAKIVNGSKAAYYPLADKIEMPLFESFNKAAGYYATLAHELTHWTGHANRLNRELKSKKTAVKSYAKEELIAELGACFLGADLGIEPVTKDQHAAYIQSWLKELKNDKKFIFQAAAQAQKAVEFINALQPSKKDKPVDLLIPM